MYPYLKALHIIFVVTWFAGLFYIPRLFIYATEAGEKTGPEQKVLREQLALMTKRLWYGITWPSAVLTLILGTYTMFDGGWNRVVFEPAGQWLLFKLIFVVLLYLYHLSLHRIFLQEMRGEFRYSSQQLRIWNEVATVLLIAIVMLVTVKQTLSFVWGIAGLIIFIFLLLAAIAIYKRARKRSK